MSFPSFGGILRATGATLGGLAQDQEDAKKEALAALVQKRQIHQDEIANALSASQMRENDARAYALRNPTDTGQLRIAPNGDAYVWHPRASTLESVTPSAPGVTKPPATGITPQNFTAALQTGPHAEITDQGAPPPTQAPASPPVTPPVAAAKPFAKPTGHIDPLSPEGIKAAVSLDSAKQVHRVPTVHAQNFVDPQGGVHLATDAEALAHKDWTKQTTAANAGSATANRQKDYLALMADALPHVKELSPTVNATAVWGLLHHPNVTGFVPGVTDNDKAYAVNIRDFITGALHEESGARLSEAQLAWGIPRFAVLPNDSPEIRAGKIADMEKLVASRAKNANYVIPGSPISDAARARLGDGGGSGTSSQQKLYDDAHAHLKAQGKSDAEIQQIIGARP